MYVEWARKSKVSVKTVLEATFNIILDNRFFIVQNQLKTQSHIR